MSSPLAAWSEDRRVLLALFAGLLLMLVAGSPYAAGTLHHDLRSYGFSESQAIAVETCAQVGLYLGLLQGLLFDRTTIVTAGLVATSCVVGGYLLAFGATALPASVSISARMVALALSFLLAGNGSHGLYTCAMATNVPNWAQHHQGKIMGALASAFGLSAAIFSGLHRATSTAEAADDSCDAANSTAPASHNNNTTTATPILSPTTYPTPLPASPQSPLIYFGVAAAMIAVVGFICTFLLYRKPLSAHIAEAKSESDANRSSTMEMVALTTGSADSDDEATEDTATLLTPDASTAPTPTPTTPAESHPVLDVHGWALLRSLDFWLLFYSMACEDGAGVTFINVLDSLHTATNTSSSATSLTVAFSLSNAFGRLGWGMLSDLWPRHRLLVLLVTLVLMAVSHALLLAAPSALAAVTVLVGVAFGGMFSLAPVITGELWGKAHLASNWGFLVIGPAIGSTIIGQIFGHFYDKEVVHSAAGCRQCLGGRRCFGSAFIIVIALLATAAATLVYLDRRVRVRRRNTYNPLTPS